MQALQQENAQLGYDTYLSRCHTIVARANLLIDPPYLVVTARVMYLC
jgi:hypothetical protein